MNKQLLSLLFIMAGAAPAFADEAKPTVEQLQKQVVELKEQLVGWQSAAGSYRAKFQAEADQSVQMKADMDKANSKAEKTNGR